MPLALLGQQFLYVLISYFPILYVLIYTIFSKLWSVDVLFDSAFPNFPICQRLRPGVPMESCFQIMVLCLVSKLLYTIFSKLWSVNVFVSKLWSFALLLWLGPQAKSNAYFLNQPNSGLLSHIVPPIMCLLMVGHGDFFDGGSLIVISLIFDFELMGWVFTNSWGFLWFLGVVYFLGVSQF